MHEKERRSEHDDDQEKKEQEDVNAELFLPQKRARKGPHGAHGRTEKKAKRKDGKNVISSSLHGNVNTFLPHFLAQNDCLFFLRNCLFKICAFNWIASSCSPSARLTSCCDARTQHRQQEKHSSSNNIITVSRSCCVEQNEILPSFPLCSTMEIWRPIEASLNRSFLLIPCSILRKKRLKSPTTSAHHSHPLSSCGPCTACSSYQTRLLLCTYPQRRR